MSALKKAFVAEVLAELEVVYLSGYRCRQWNAHRNRTQPAMFTGWYWLNGKAEAGPFKTRSAALRDGWYRMISGDTPPGLRSVNRSEKRNDRRNSE